MPPKSTTWWLIYFTYGTKLHLLYLLENIDWNNGLGFLWKNVDNWTELPSVHLGFHEPSIVFSHLVIWLHHIISYQGSLVYTPGRTPCVYYQECSIPDKGHCSGWSRWDYTEMIGVYLKYTTRGKVFIGKTEQEHLGNTYINKKWS